MSLPRIGFVGLGSQGGPMARAIVDAGFPTTLWARRPEPLAPYADTAALVAPTLGELGAASDVLCVCVVSDADVGAVLRGDDGALAAMPDGGIVVIHSTVHPDTCRRLQADFPGLCVIDAPVSGGGHKAATRELLVMAGGDAEAFERCRPVLETFANPLLHLGPLGAGQEAKLLNNAVFTAQLGLAADVYALAAERGLDVAALTTVLNEGSGRSYAAQVVAGSGHHLGPLGKTAGPLLAKDVGILGDLLGTKERHVIEAALTALSLMGMDEPENPR
jgi:3-hydroxyisobutyrate dehydrogenase